MNPGLALPRTNITVVHREDDSGTTFLFSELLSRSSEPWRTQVGAAQSLRWPLGEGRSGNGGVAATVQRTRVSIGDVEYAYARQHRLISASVRNASGEFARPRRESFEAATAAVPWREFGDLSQLLIGLPGRST